MPIARLCLSDFRSYADALDRAGAGLRHPHRREWRGQDQRARSGVPALPRPRPEGREPGRDGAARRPRRLRGGGARGRRRYRHRHARSRARAPPGPHRRRAGLGQFAVGMAVRPLAHPRHGPPVRRRRLGPAPLPRPARPRAEPRPRHPRRPLRSRDARPQQAAGGARPARRGLADRAGGADGRAWRRHP